MRWETEEQLMQSRPIVYLALAVIWSTLVTLGFGAALSLSWRHLPMIDGAIWMLLMAGTGWCVQLIVSFWMMERKRWMNYAAHLGAVMSRGVAALLPVILWTFLIKPVNWWFPLVMVAISSSWMLGEHFLRVREMRISQAWTAAWFLSLQATAAFWVYQFLSYGG